MSPLDFSAITLMKVTFTCLLADAGHRAESGHGSGTIGTVDLTN